MNYKTEGPDLSVREFYNLYKKQLPKIVLINQGFYDDMGNDTFSREQVLRLHTTTQRKRVLVRSFNGIATKTYSMSINYPVKFCVKTTNGEFSAEQSLLSIMREHKLPVNIRLPRDRAIVVNNQQVRNNDLLEMEMIKTFDEISFLANDIDNGLMTTEVLKLPLCLESVRFKLVTGLTDNTKRYWQVFNNRLNLQSRGIPYDEEPGIEDIAQYRESQVTEDVDFSRLEPAFFVNLQMIASSNSVSNQKMQSSNDDNTYESYEAVKKGDNKSEVKNNFMKEIAAAVVKTGKGFKKTIATAKTPTAKPKPDISPKPIQFEEVGAKPKTAPKPAKKPQRKVEERKTDESNANQKLPLSQRSVSWSDGSRNPKLKDQSERKTFSTELELKISDCERTYYNTTNQVDVYSRTEDEVDMDFSSHTYVNLENMAIISPLSKQRIPPANLVARKLERQKAGIPESSRVAVSFAQQSLSKNLTSEEIASLSINEVTEYLKLLKLDCAIDLFRESQVDGKLLSMLTDDILKNEFNLKAFQILKLKNFVRDGHIPQ